MIQLSKPVPLFQAPEEAYPCNKIVCEKVCVPVTDNVWDQFGFGYGWFYFILFNRILEL